MTTFGVVLSVLYIDKVFDIKLEKFNEFAAGSENLLNLCSTEKQQLFPSTIFDFHIVDFSKDNL